MGISTKCEDYIYLRQIEEETQEELGVVKIRAVLEFDYNCAPFYTVLSYELNGANYEPNKYNPTIVDKWVDDIALRYWTDDRMKEILWCHDACLDYYREQANEYAQERNAWLKAVL